MVKRMFSFLMLSIVIFLLNGCDLNLQVTPEATPDPSFNVEPFDRLFNDARKKTITIEISEAKWQELDQEMQTYYALYEDYRTDYMVEANMVFSDAVGEVRVDHVGFRTRGNLSRNRIQDDEGNLNPQHFKIKFNKDYVLENSNRTVFELEELDIKYNRNWDSTYLTEKYSLDVFRQMGVYAAYTTLIEFRLKIGQQETLYGVYTAFEPIDQKFIERRIEQSESDGPLYKSLWQQYGPANLGYPIPLNAIGLKDESLNYRPAYDLKTNKTKEDHQALQTFIYDINHWDDQTFEANIETRFDVDRFLRYLAVGVFLGNPDDYRAMGNNYYLYRQSTTGIWMIFPYDYDHGLGQGWDGAPVFTNWTIGADIYTWGNLNASQLGEPDYPHVLVDRLLAIPKYQLNYETYLHTLIEENIFSYDAFGALYHQQLNLYEASTVDALHPVSFGLRNIEWYLNEKTADVLAQLAYYQSNPSERGL